MAINLVAFLFASDSKKRGRARRKILPHRGGKRLSVSILRMYAVIEIVTFYERPLSQFKSRCFRLGPSGILPISNILIQDQATVVNPSALALR